MKIEDPDAIAKNPEAPDIVIPFELWPEQAEVLDVFDKSRLSIVLKARQLGFTWLGLSYCLWNMVFKPGFTVVGLSKGEDEAKELVRRLKFILENAPRWLIRHASDAKEWDGPTWESQVLNIKVLHPGGSPARFLGEAASKDSGRSFTANIILIDEWAAQNWAREIWQAAFPTVNRPTGGKVIGISTARPATLFHEIWKAAPENGFTKVFLPWWVDPRRTDDWYEKTKLAMGGEFAQEFPGTVDEAFSQGIDRFFRSFNARVHVYNPEDYDLPKDWTNIRGMDWGFSAPYCVLWGRVDYDGRIWIYRELYDKQQTVPVVADLIKKIEKDADEDIKWGVGDTSIWNRLGGPSIGELFNDNGVVWTKADKDRVNGWAQVHVRLRTRGENERPMLMISNTCVNLIRELSEMLQDKNNPEDADTKLSDHGIDALRYLCCSRPFTPKVEQPLPPWYKKTNGKRKSGSWMSF